MRFEGRVAILTGPLDEAAAQSPFRPKPYAALS
jgi:hypothetical protein